MALKRSWPTPPPMVRAGLLVGSGVLLIGAALWAGSVGPWVARPQGNSTAQLPTFDPPTFHPPTFKNVDPPAANTGGSSFDPSIVLIVLGGVLLVALLLMAASMIKNRAGEATPRRKVVHEDEVRPAPVAPDPARPFDVRQAADYVIACWDQLEQRAAVRGVGRHPEQTPTEFMDALKGIYPLDERAAAELLSLYQRARFDHVRLQPDTAIRARSCADALLGALDSAANPGNSAWAIR